jgi:SAM-dependent methyltransferase
MRFPFPGYMKHCGEPYRVLAETVLAHAPEGSRVLDFGAGACDKTAVLQALGFQCTACDDLEDPWHRIPGNREKILEFAGEAGIAFRVVRNSSLPFEARSFEVVLALNVLEHLHDSPRELLLDLIELVSAGGYLVATVPNAVNLRKRLAVLCGRSNLPPFNEYFWSVGPWRGHVREYVKNDLDELARSLRLEVVQLRSYDHMLWRLPRVARPVFRAVSVAFPGWRDSWLLVARRPKEWNRDAVRGPHQASDQVAR